jgi:hypothetical protein
MSLQAGPETEIFYQPDNRLFGDAERHPEIDQRFVDLDRMRLSLEAIYEHPSNDSALFFPFDH